MNIISTILLSVTVILSAGRNIFSKSVSDVPFATKNFYLVQSLIFFSGFSALLIFSKLSFKIAPLTVLYALIYGVLLLSAQWLYTIALKTGNTAICSTIYSLGFIFPTLSGSLFWGEALSVINFIGILAVIPAVIISGMQTDSSNEKRKNTYILPLIIAMLSSGGLGIMQKVQQNSPYPEQKSIFVLLSFGFAAAVSIIFAAVSKRHRGAFTKKKYLFSICVGICFGCCNLLNTTLAGRLDSALFFPMLNICVILLSLLLGVIVFKERIQKKEIGVLALGILSIILLNIK